MRCQRLQATIPVSTCLSKQAEIEKFVPMRKIRCGSDLVRPNIIASPCLKCPQGEQAKKGECMDEDVEKLKDEVQPDRTELNRKVRESKARMKAANRPEPMGIKQDPAQFTEPLSEKLEKLLYDNVNDLLVKSEPERTLSVEIAGQRIVLCPECARRYLRI